MVLLLQWLWRVVGYSQLGALRAVGSLLVDVRVESVNHLMQNGQGLGTWRQAHDALLAHSAHRRVNATFAAMLFTYASGRCVFNTRGCRSGLVCL